MDGSALTQKPPGLRSDRTEEVDLELDRGVPDTSREHGMYGAAHRGVEQGAGETAMDGTDRIVVTLGWCAFEDHPALLYLRRPEAHQLADRRQRQLPFLHRPEELQAAHLLGCSRVDGRVLPANCSIPLGSFTHL